MPLTKKGKAIFAAMKSHGPKKAKQAFYAADSNGTIKGVHYARKNIR